MLNYINYGYGFGCGHNVCLCVNLLLPPGLQYVDANKISEYILLIVVSFRLVLLASIPQLLFYLFIKVMAE